MINSSAAYKAAIVADARQVVAKALVSIIDPDIVYGSVDGSEQAAFGNSLAISDQEFTEPAPIVTLEKNRWILDGSFSIFDNGAAQNAPFVTSAIAGADGTFETPVFAELQFSGVAVLQAVTVAFPDNGYDGVPEDFVIEIKQGGSVRETKNFSGNRLRTVSVEGFTVYNADAIRVAVSKMSLPFRRFRCIEIYPGVIDEWTGRTLASFSIKHQGDPSTISVPYGTCRIEIDNQDRRFDPRNKEGLFKSIEDKQGVKTFMGVVLPDGTTEFMPTGVYYHHSGSWKTAGGGLTIAWDLVDIVGLLSACSFSAPAVLPTTLSGWVASVVSQLGSEFETKYRVDENYANLPLVTTKEAVSGVPCADLLRYICMASGTWPRADAETGNLACEPLWQEGGKTTLANLNEYPAMSAHNDISSISFTLADANKTVVDFSGNASSGETLSISNPFIYTQAQAATAAKWILSFAGGNTIEMIGRGDMSCEIGDVDTVWLDESTATTARRTMQSLELQDGVLQNAKSVLLQAAGAMIGQNRAEFVSDGEFVAPEGVSELRVILVGHGKNGENGTDGTWDNAGADGADGLGANIWHGTIYAEPGDRFAVFVGEETAFGAYTSANGHVYPNGLTDIESGKSYGRTGVKSPLPNSGDGGIGGAGGVQGNRRFERVQDENGQEKWDLVIDNHPGVGSVGVPGASGIAIVYWSEV